MLEDSGDGERNLVQLDRWHRERRAQCYFVSGGIHRALVSSGMALWEMGFELDSLVG